MGTSRYGVPDGLELYDTQTSAGWGVRATRDWRVRSKGGDPANFVGYYRGELMTGAALERRYTDKDPKYAIQIGEEDWYIDAAGGGRGTWARFINDPGVPGGGNVSFVSNVRRREVWVVLTRDLKKGEQLLAEYDPNGSGSEGGGFCFGDSTVLRFGRTGAD